VLSYRNNVDIDRIGTINTIRFLKKCCLKCCADFNAVSPDYLLSFEIYHIIKGLGLEHVSFQEVAKFMLLLRNRKKAMRC
jgi:hypothetical protein